MKRLNTFVLVLSTLLAIVYTYTIWRMENALWMRVLLAFPFIFVWLIPVLYWKDGRERDRKAYDHALHYTGYLSMGWLSFLFVFTVLKDIALLVTNMSGMYAATNAIDLNGSSAVLIGSGAAMLIGALHARTGPVVRHVDIPITDLPPGLNGFRIVQISDLHVGPTIHASYVRRVVDAANVLAPDLVALTGDIVDGPISELLPHVAPLAELAPKDRVFFITGNHEYYAGADVWMEHFRSIGHTVLTNSHRTIEHKGARLHVGGVLDPAARIVHRDLGPDPKEALGDGATSADFRLLLAHNPKLAPAAAQAGYDLQLSGHTHAGQFFPWTLVTRIVHAPHFAGLSREGKLWVYVSAGTGTWGPPIRLGTRPELTLLRLLRA